MTKPIIGIVSKPTWKVKEDIWNRMDIQDEFRLLVLKNGGVSISLLPTDKTMEFNSDDIHDTRVLTDEEKEDLKRVVSLCDGIILEGGLVSSNYEIEIARIAIKQDKPLLGICAGFNNILRALGSDVVLDETRLHDVYDVNYRHEVSIEKDTLLYDIIKTQKLNVNSIHSMIAPKENVVHVAKPTAYSDDGLVESFELPDKKFVLGVKWHPELMQDDYVDRLFKTFITACYKKENVTSEES